MHASDLMTTIYLIRHAHAHWQPDEQRPLSSRGERDAQRVATLLHPLPISALYASTARRASQTIAPLAARVQLPIESIHDLRERVLSHPPAADFAAAVRRTWDDPAWAWPGGETNLAAQQRGVRVVRQLARTHAGQQIVVATHGNLLALILQHYDPSIGWAFWQALSMPDVYRLMLDPPRQPQIQRLWSLA